MTAATKPKHEAPARKRAPNLRLVAAAAKSPGQAPATRPLLNRSSKFVRDLQVLCREAEGEINLIDATEARADKAFDENISRLDTDHQEAIERLNVSHREKIDAATAMRDAEREAQRRLRAEFAEIYERCSRALADGADAPAIADRSA